MGVSGQCHVPAALPLVPIVQEAGWARAWSGQVRKISPPTRIQSPDHPAHSESLFWLRSPSPWVFVVQLIITELFRDSIFFVIKIHRSICHGTHSTTCSDFKLLQLYYIRFSNGLRTYTQFTLNSCFITVWSHACVHFIRHVIYTEHQLQSFCLNLHSPVNSCPF